MARARMPSAYQAPQCQVVVPAWIEITMDVMSANATDAGTGASNFRIIRAP